MLRAVNQEAFASVIEDLNYLGRKKVRLLKEKDVPISEEAQRLLDSFKEEDVITSTIR